MNLLAEFPIAAQATMSIKARTNINTTCNAARPLSSLLNERNGDLADILPLHIVEFWTGSIAAAELVRANTPVLQLENDRLVDRVKIESQSKEKQKLGLVLHVQGHVKLPADFKPDDSFADNHPSAFRYWTGCTTATFQDQANFEVRFGETLLNVKFLVPSDFQIWHASTPDTPPDRRQGFYLETLGTLAVFKTEISPAR